MRIDMIAVWMMSKKKYIHEISLREIRRYRIEEVFVESEMVYNGKDVI